MSWLKIIIECNKTSLHNIEQQLLAQGAQAITLEDQADQPLFEPPPGHQPVWDETRLSALFSADHDPAKIMAHVKLNGQSWRSEILEDKDWVRAWMDDYQPMKFGENFWIVPSWLEAPEPEAINMQLDPGLAFGTGTHPTTHLCLDWLAQQQVAGKLIIDYGCGSGILAIACLLMGADKVIAVDNDPQAIQATRENAKRNNICLSQLEIYSPQALEKLAEQPKADIFVANILVGPLLSLYPRFLELTKSGSMLLLSGLLAEQQQLITEKYQQHFLLNEPSQLEDWIRLSGTRS